MMIKEEKNMMMMMIDDGVGGGEEEVLTLEEEKVRQVFDTFDENKDGRISREEMWGTLNKLGQWMSEEEMDHLIEGADLNKDGYVDFHEFLALYSSLNITTPSSPSSTKSGNSGNVAMMESGSCKEEEEESVILEAAFQVFDENGDGFISSWELQAVLTRLGLLQPCPRIIPSPSDNDIGNSSLVECEEMIKRVDVDGDGRVSFHEFKTMMMLMSP